MEKSTMRFIVRLITIVASILAVYVVFIWSFEVLRNNILSQNSEFKQTIDISQQSALILGMFGIAATGKFVQKFAERPGGVNNKLLNMNTNNNEKKQ